MAAEAAALAREVALVDDEAEVRTILSWIGFNTAMHRETVSTEAFVDYVDLMATSEKDISAIADSFQKRRPVATSIVFGQRRIKKLKAITYWAKDFRRRDKQPTIDGLGQNDFLTELDTATRRHEIRVIQIKNSTLVMKEASPGTLESESKWNDWEPALENYLASGFGTDGVPLNYVVREKETPDAGATYADFTEECIACAPLSGPAYDADKRQVHQYIVSFTQGQLSEDWIKSIKSQQDGREDMAHLRAHFSGEGNATRRIAVAERLRESLHYRNERSVSFELYLHKCQKMFNIFEQQKEPMTEEAKVRFLLQKCLHPQLENAVETLRSRMALTTGSVTVASASNYLASRVSELPDYISKNRSINALESDNNDAPASGVTKSDGTIHTGHFPNWLDLSIDDRKKVANERQRLGLGKGKKRTEGKKKDFKKLQNLLKKGKRQIAALKKKVTFDENEDKVKENDETNDDAGNAFGGKRQKKGEK